MAWDDESKKSTRRRAASRRSHSHSHARRRRRRRVVGAATCDCIAPSRLTGLRGSVPRRFISCRNAGPFLCLPFFLGHRESPPPSILFPLRFSRRGHREHVCFILLVAAENPSPCRICPSLWRLSSPRNPGNSNEGYFTQSTVSEDFAEIPVLDAFALFPFASVPRELSLLLSYSIVQKFSKL